MIVFIETDTSGASPYPELSAEGFTLPRGTYAMGGPPMRSLLPENFTLSVEDGSSRASGLTDFMRGVGWLVVSEKLKHIFERYGADIEFISIGLRYRGETWGGYFIANPRNRVHGVDLAASSIELDDVGVALGVERLVLDESKFAGVPVAVLHETTHIALQSEVAEAIRAAGCTGCVFVPPSSVSI